MKCGMNSGVGRKMVQKEVNNGQNMKPAVLNKYLVYALNPSYPSCPPKPPSPLRKSRPLGASGRDLLSPECILSPKWS